MDKTIFIRLFQTIWKARLLSLRHPDLTSLATETSYHAILIDAEGKESYDIVYETDILRTNSELEASSL
jgi:hypothetical protein